MSNIQTGAERMPHDLSHLGFLAGQIGRLITISTTPRSEERFSRNAETDLVCRLLLEKKKDYQAAGLLPRGFYSHYLVCVVSLIVVPVPAVFVVAHRAHVDL